MKKLESCIYCGVIQAPEFFKDSYESIHFICDNCFDKNTDKWEKEKEHFSEVDYKYE